jgi:hypothetical protein
MFVLIRTENNVIIVLRKFAVPQNTKKWKQLDTSMIQNHNKLQKVGITAQTSDDYKY